jgi:D-3-phosphoglycerate dehydrogenase
MRPKLLLSHPPEILAQYFGEAPLAALREVADVTLNEAGRTMTEPELLAAARGQEIIVLDRTTPGPPALFETSPALAAVCRVAVDIRNIDVAAASAAGVLVTQATPGFVEAVAEWIVGAMIDLARGLTRCSMTYRAGEEPATHTGRQLSTAVVGIVGYGRIARRLHALLTPFGSRILASDPYLMAEPDGPELVGLDDLLARSDFVVCLAVATEETESLFDASRFGRMKRGAFFVNASRGVCPRERTRDRSSRRGGARRRARARSAAEPVAGGAAGRDRHAAHRRQHAGSRRPPGLGRRAPGERACARRDSGGSRQRRQLDAPFIPRRRPLAAMKALASRPLGSEPASS